MLDIQLNGVELCHVGVVMWRQGNGVDLFVQTETRFRQLIVMVKLKVWVDFLPYRVQTMDGPILEVLVLHFYQIVLFVLHDAQMF
jgi:hypothetical protein